MDLTLMDRFTELLRKMLYTMSVTWGRTTKLVYGVILMNTEVLWKIVCLLRVLLSYLVVY
jgi:hypothetical protein